MPRHLLLVALETLRRLLHRRAAQRQTLLVLAVVALRNRNDAERLRRAHASVLALYNERGRELERLYGRLRELEDGSSTQARAA